MGLWCNCNPRREAEAKAAKWDAFMERSGGLSGLVRLFEGSCEVCPAFDYCEGCADIETCYLTRAEWLLGV